MADSVGDLTGEEREGLERQRSWVRDHYEPEARSAYDTIPGKIRLLHAILKNGWVRGDETWKLQSLGVTLGDALAQHLNLVWVAVEDEYGRDPALQVPGTTVLLYPLTLISKRIEDGTAFDIVDLFDGLCEAVREAQGEADECPPE